MIEGCQPTRRILCYSRSMSAVIQLYLDDESAEKLRLLASANHLTLSGTAASIIFQFFIEGEVLTKKAPGAKMISRPTWRHPKGEWPGKHAENAKRRRKRLKEAQKRVYSCPLLPTDLRCESES